MLRFGLAQFAGSLLLLAQAALPDARMLLLPAAACLVLAILVHRIWPLGFLLGILLAWHAASVNLAERLPPELAGETLLIEGLVLEPAEHDGRRQRFLFEIDNAWRDGDAVSLPEKVRLSLYEAGFTPRAGERWRWLVRLREPRGFGNPGGFDYERWLFANGIGATGYVFRPENAKRLEDAAGYGAWREGVLERLRSLTQDAPSAGLILALAGGDRRDLSDADWEVLRRTGTAHLMAISGLHAGLVVGLVLMCAGFVQRRRWRPSMHPLAMLFAFACGLAYAGLAGFGLPVRRALVMTGVALLVLAARRERQAGPAFGAALSAVLIVEPLAPLADGFWLSFGAVAALMYIFAGRRGGERNWQQAVRAQLALSILLAPFLLAAFGRIPLISPLANLIAIPVVGFLVVPLLLVATVLLPWPSAASGLLAAAGFVLEKLFALLGWLAVQAPEWTPGTGAAGLAFLLAAGLLAAAPRGLPAWRWLPFLLLPLLFPRPDIGPGELRVTVLDVGQGQAVALQTANHTFIYDTGPSFGSGDAGAYVIEPFLAALGRAPEIIMVSHADSDHAGGLEYLREAFPEARVFGPVAGGEPCFRGQHWSLSGVEFRVLHPAPGEVWSDNNGSCVLRVDALGWSLLLTGDIEAQAEQALLNCCREDLNVDLVLMPHHGSRTSSTPGFVAAVSATAAIAAAGYDNRWGFPRPDVVRRWRESGADVLVTGERGALSLRNDRASPEGFSLVSWRESEPRLWRYPPEDGAKVR